VYEVAEAAYKRARAGEGPSLIEALTYRHKGHSRADPGKYRPDEEVEEWLNRDPINIYRERLESLGVSPETIDVIEAKALAEVDAATEESKNAPPPDPGVLMTDVWADGGSSWRN
jgi:pyruvate dehydrogenase E1 component alpha subunit